MAETNPVQSAERIFQIFEALAKNGPMTLTQLSTQLGLHKTTVHRLLGSLVAMDYARKDAVSGQYRLTLKILELSGRVLEKMDILPVAHPFIEKLAEESHETVHFVQREGTNIVYIDKVESNVNSVRMVSRVGLRQPMYCTAVGKALLAELPLDEVKKVWEKSRIEKLTAGTITDFEVMLEELREIRERGYALDNEENELGVRCIAACVFSYDGKAANAFSISAPTTRMNDARIQELSGFVLEAKQNLSRALGFVR